MFKKVICYLLATAFVLAVGGVQFVLPVDANHIGNTEVKIYDTATLDHDFVDNHVMVILTNTASLDFRNYTPADFSEISCKSVQNLSSAKGAKVQAKLRGEEIAVASTEVSLMSTNINENAFRTILCLELETPGKGKVLQAIRALEQRSDVYYVGPDYILPCGPVSPDILPLGWGFEAIELSYAQQIETGSSSVKVGVLDSGIDASHPALQGRVNTSLSRNFASDSYSATTDPLGHGTHVAGIIGGVGNNSPGICKNVTLVSLRVADATNFISASAVANAINYAEGNGIPILNISLEADTQGITALQQALANYSGVAVCAAGNNNINADLGSVIPGSMTYDNIICVGASTQGNAKASFSNYGQVAVDLFAPGDGISSCFPRSLCSSSNCTVSGHISYGYHFMSGTSMAAPMVAGVAALMLSADGSLTCSEIKALILDNVKDYAAFSNICVSGGILNAKNIFSLHSMHRKHAYYVYASSNVHRRCCYKCSTTVLEPHVYDSTGSCLLCS